MRFVYRIINLFRGRKPQKPAALSTAGKEDYERWLGIWSFSPFPEHINRYFCLWWTITENTRLPFYIFSINIHSFSIIYSFPILRSLFNIKE